MRSKLMILFNTYAHRILRLVAVMAAAIVPMSANTAAAIQNGQLQTSAYTYTGGITAGKQNGYGVARYTNGNVYYGYWDMGYKQGLGRIDFADGRMDFGMWHRGTLAKDKNKHFKVGERVYGIDVSWYQKKIDWTKLALRANAQGKVSSNGKTGKYYQPVLFAVAKSTEGATIVDNTFQYNFKEAKRCGMIRGAYHFFSTLSKVEDQVENYIRNTPLEKGDLPPILDLEIKAEIMRRNHDKVCKEAKQWLELIEKHYGVKPIIYTFENYYLDYMKGHGFDKYDFWIAHHSAEPNSRHWEIWQFTETGRIPGINNAVDIDLFRGNYSDLKKYVKKKGIK